MVISRRLFSVPNDILAHFYHMVAFQLFRLNGFCVFIKVMIFFREACRILEDCLSIHFFGDSFMIIWDSGQPIYVYFERVV